MELKKILLAVDESQCSLQGVAMAALLSGEKKTPVVVLHVMPPMPVMVTEDIPSSSDYLTVMTDHYKEDAKKAAQKLLDSYKEQLKPYGMPVSEVVAFGDPAERILNVIEKEGCDIVVIGACGKSSIESLLIGSVSNKVLHYAKVPVLIAR